MMPEPAATSMLSQVAIAVVATILLLVASVNDIATRTIPDCIPIGLGALGIPVHLSNHDFTAALVASCAIFILAGLCWRQGWLGGGDVKLIVACTWLASPVQVPTLVLGTALAGGGLAGVYLGLCWMIRRSQAPATIARRRSFVARIYRVERWRIGRHASLPYACAIAAAMLFTLYSG